MAVVDSILVAFGFKIDTKELERLKSVSSDAAKAAEADARATKEAWDKVGSGLNRLALGVAGAVVGIGKLIQSAAASGAALDDVTQQLGVSAREFQRFAFAVEMGGGTVDDAKNSYKFLQKALIDARTAATPAAEAFKKLGLGVGQLSDRSLSDEQRFALIADAFKNVSEQAQKTDIALTLFGRGGLALIPTLSEGADGLQRMGDRAEELGLVKTQAAITKMAELDDKILELKLRATAWAESLAHELVPVIEDIIKHWNEWKIAIGAIGLAWAALKVPSIISQVGALAGVVKVLGAAIMSHPVVAMAALGVAIGTALDNALKLSDALAGVKGTQGGRGAMPTIGELRAADALVDRAEDAPSFRLSAIERTLETASGAQRAALIAQRNAIIAEVTAPRRAARQAAANEMATKAQQEADTKILQDGLSELQKNALAANAEAIKNSKNKGKRPDKKQQELKKARAGLEGSAMFTELRAVAARHGATAGQIDLALNAAAEAKVGQASDRVAKEAAVGKLSGLLGYDVGARYQDPLLSDLFGGVGALPPVPLSELERGQQPQVLISTINNTYTIDSPISISGAGEPHAVGTALQEAIRSLFRNEVDKVSRFSKVVFQR